MIARTGPHPDQPCSGGCGAMLKHDPRRKGTLCRACRDATIRLPARHCIDCDVRIGSERKNPSGRCLRHAQAMNERRERIRQSMLKRHADPVFRVRRGRAIRAAERSARPSSRTSRSSTATIIPSCCARPA